MAEFYNSYTNGADGGCFGNRFRSWKASNDTRTDPFANSDTNHDHVCRPVIVGTDGRDRPMVLDYPQKHHNKETTTMVEQNTYRVQPASTYSREYMPGDRKTGYSGGMFQLQKPNYAAPEPAPIRKIEWAPPSPNRIMEYLTGSARPNSDTGGWVRSSQNHITEYLMGSARPNSDAGWARSSQNTSAEYLMGSSGPISNVGSPRSRWKTPPPSEGRLGKVTSDIGTTVDYLKGSAAPAAATTTDRWGPSSLSSEYGGRKVSGTIDSREAVKRYNGQHML